MLYIADDVVFVGTAVKSSPSGYIAPIQVGKGVAGTNQRKLQEEFFAVPGSEASTIATTG